MCISNSCSWVFGHIENGWKVLDTAFPDGMVTVVVHSTKKFADATAGIYGSTSTVARVTSKGSQDGQSSAGDGPSERDVIDMLVTVRFNIKKHFDFVAWQHDIYAAIRHCFVFEFVSTFFAWN